VANKKEAMMLEVVLDVYSGRPNPEWALSPSEERKLLDVINQITSPTLLKPPGVLPLLGYRGFRVRGFPTSSEEGLSLLIHNQIIDFGQTSPNRIADNRSLEEFLLETGKSELPAMLVTRITKELSQPPVSPTELLRIPEGGNCPVSQAADAPAYNPAVWNNNSATRQRNNCYNYANDQITNTFAQPGSAHGVFPTNIECVDYQQAAAADGLAACAGSNNPLRAEEGWYVALVIAPDEDFHWYRQDDNGCWSHKPGGAYATNLDNAGQLITDPPMCDRGMYTDFCTYMITNRDVVIQ
jgi:hypothetical protein